MRTTDLDYELPSRLIATVPAEPRESAKLLVVDRASRTIAHRRVGDLPEVLRADDTLVFNTTSVLAARLIARRASGRCFEGLALGPVRRDAGQELQDGASLDSASSAPSASSASSSSGASGTPTNGSVDRRWRVLFRGSARLHVGERIELVGADGVGHGDSVELSSRDGEAWLVEFVGADGERDARAILDRSGRVPLPPYIRRARAERGTAADSLVSAEDDATVSTAHSAQADDPRDRGWYQTVYADPTRAGSVAAPTAGLHFTPELLRSLAARGTGRIDVTLHVGMGTFKPVAAERLEDHPMHAEWFEVGVDAQRALLARKAAGTRVIAVGTTSARALESLPSSLLAGAPEHASSQAIFGETRLLIAPGHRWQYVDGLLTNFHLPRSTLLALVAGLIDLPWLKEIYREAIAREYRFYSYGDAMLVV